MLYMGNNVYRRWEIGEWRKQREKGRKEKERPSIVLVWYYGKPKGRVGRGEERRKGEIDVRIDVLLVNGVSLSPLPSLLRHLTCFCFSGVRELCRI